MTSAESPAPPLTAGAGGIYKVTWSTSDWRGEPGGGRGEIVIYDQRVVGTLAGATGELEAWRGPVWQVIFGWIEDGDELGGTGVVYFSGSAGLVLPDMIARDHGYLNRPGHDAANLNIAGWARDFKVKPGRQPDIIVYLADEALERLEQDATPESRLREATRFRASAQASGEYANAVWRKQVHAAKASGMKVTEIAKVTHLKYQYIQQVLDGSR